MGVLTILKTGKINTEEMILDKNRGIFGYQTIFDGASPWL